MQTMHLFAGIGGGLLADLKVDFYGREFVDELRAKERKFLSPSQVRQLAEDAIEYYSKELREREAA